ncbi:MAG: VPLPA-CTERM sorting domain-containing protein [Parvularcula sp.]
MRILATLATATALVFAPANAAVLTTGVGDGSVTIDTNGFGSSRSAVYDPVGAIGPADTFFDSFVYFQLGGGRTNSGTNLEVLEQSDTRYVTRFSVGSLLITLTQTVTEAFDGGVRTGSLFQQSFQITNTAAVPNSFDLVRYLDGDLGFDGSISDGGGVLDLGGTRVLYETDAAEGSSAAATFVGISTTGGNAGLDQNFEIDSFSGLRSRIQSGASLDNQVTGDTDGDGFINDPYDVTLALQDFFQLGVNETVTWTTNTLFGNAVPPMPGSTEALPLLPSPASPEGAFFFEIDPADIVENEIIWIDPVISVGYTYEVTGAEFSAVQMPSLASVPDADGYTLFYNDGSGEVSVALVAGELFTFATNVTTFRIEGIDVSLMLDPGNPLAFVTGIALANVGGGPVTISQTPITLDVGGAAVPLPAGIWLMGTGLAAAYGARRRKLKLAAH